MAWKQRLNEAAAMLPLHLNEGRSS